MIWMGFFFFFFLPGRTAVRIMLRRHRCKRQIHDKNPLKCQNYSGHREELRQLCSCKCLNYPWNCCLTPCNVSHIPNYIHSSLLARICRDSHRKKHEQPIEGTLSPCEEGRQRSFIDNLGVSMKEGSQQSVMMMHAQQDNHSEYKSLCKTSHIPWNSTSYEPRHTVQSLDGFIVILRRLFCIKATEFA